MDILQSLEAQVGSGVVTVLIVAGLVAWARAPGHSERVLIVGSAVAMTAVAAGIYVVAVSAGWWRGTYFTLPPLVQAGILLTVTLLAWTLWLAGYRWLADHTKQPVEIYLAISLVLLLLVAIAHRFNLGQGTILVGPGWTIVIDAAIAQLILWVPVLIYEALRRNFERFEPLP